MFLVPIGKGNIPSELQKSCLASQFAACCPSSDSHQQLEHAKLLTQLPLSVPPAPDHPDPPGATSITDLQRLRPAERRQSLGA